MSEENQKKLFRREGHRCRMNQAQTGCGVRKKIRSSTNVRHLEILVITSTVKESGVIEEHGNIIKGSPWWHCHNKKHNKKIKKKKPCFLNKQFVTNSYSEEDLNAITSILELLLLSADLETWKG